MKYFKFLNLFFVILLFAGCTSPKDVSKRNFKKILNEYLEKNCIELNKRFYLPATIKVSRDRTRIHSWEKTSQANLQAHQALVHAGLLEVRHDHTGDFIEGSHEGGEDGLVRTNIYTLSDEGKKYVKKPLSSWKSDPIKFCLGISKVNNVNGFTKVMDLLVEYPPPITNVDYTFSPKIIYDWAKNHEVQKAFPNISKSLEPNQIQSNTLLVLTKDGWMHEDDASPW